MSRVPVQDRQLPRLAARLRSWLSRERGKSVVRDLARLRDDDHVTLAQHCAGWLDVSVVETLIARSYARLNRNPPEAVTLARVALAFAARTPCDRRQGTAASLSGHAWRQYAQALVDCGE